MAPHIVLLEETNLEGVAELIKYIETVPTPGSPPSSVDAKHSAVLAYAEAMTLSIQVPEGVFQRLREVGFNDREIVDLTATVAAYNFVTRCVTALDIEEKPYWKK